MRQTQIQIPEEMEKVIKNVKEFFVSRDIKFRLNIYEVGTWLDVSKSLRADFYFDKPYKFSNKEFNKLINSLKELGFQHVNKDKNVVMRFITENYKICEIYDAYKHLQENDLVIFIKYVKKDESGNKTTITLNDNAISIIKDKMYENM